MKDLFTKQLLHMAAQIDQLYIELEAVGKDQSVSLSASHELSVLLSYLRSASSRLIKLSGRI